MLFRGSITSPARPLSTLRCALAGRQRMTRGRRDLLDLRRRALSSPTPCRFIPTLSPITHHVADPEPTRAECRSKPGRPRTHPNPPTRPRPTNSIDGPTDEHHRLTTPTATSKQQRAGHSVVGRGPRRGFAGVAPMHRSGSVARRRNTRRPSVSAASAWMLAFRRSEATLDHLERGAQPSRFAPRATEPTSELAGLKTAGGG
jgi:hypothetical protein